MTFPEEGVFEGSCGCGPSVGSDGEPVDVRCNPRKGPCPPEAWPKYKGTRFAPRKGPKAAGIWDRFAGRFLRDPAQGCKMASMEGSESLTSELEQGTFIPYSQRFDLFRHENGLWTVYDNKTASLLLTVKPWKSRAGAVGWIKKHTKDANKYFCHPSSPVMKGSKPPKAPKPPKAAAGKKPGRFVPAVPGGPGPAFSSEEQESSWQEQFAPQLGSSPGPESSRSSSESMGMSRFTGDDDVRENPGKAKGLAGLKRKLAAHDNAIHALQKGQKKLGERVKRQGSALISVLKHMGGQKNHLRKLTAGH